MSRKFPVVLILSLLLVACKTQLEGPTTAPGNFQVTAGDSSATLTWDENPNLIYSVYFQVGDTVTTGDYIGFLTRIHSPYIVTGLANQAQYAFILNASNHGSAPGPSTPVLTVTPGATAGGTSWTVGVGLTAGQALRSVASGGTTYVAVGDGRSIFLANESNTASGIGTWNAPPNALPVNAGINLASVIFNGAAFVVLAADGEVMTSPDTVTWTAATNVDSGGIEMTGLAYGGGVYVAVGRSGLIKTNSGAIDIAWVKQISGTTGDLFGVSYLNGNFVAVGKGGLMVTSPDGVTWTVRNSGTTNDLYKTAYGAGVYVAVGNKGTVVTSPDLINWAAGAQLTQNNLYSIAYGVNKQFVVVGQLGTVLYSPLGTDGTWQQTSAGGGDLNDIVAGANTFVAVGNSGANVSGK